MAAATAGELLYFPLRARAESARLAAAFSGVHVSDTLITVGFEGAQWPGELKEQMPKGQLPVLRLADGTLMPESVDITMYIATRPDIPTERQLLVDATAQRFLELSQARPLSICTPLLNWFAAEEAEPQLTALRDAAAEHWGPVEEQLSTSGGPFLAGALPGVGDIGLLHCASNYALLLPGVFDAFSQAFGAWRAAVASLPGVREYLAERPKTGTGNIGRPGSIARTKALD